MTKGAGNHVEGQTFFCFAQGLFRSVRLCYGVSDPCGKQSCPVASERALYHVLHGGLRDGLLFQIPARRGLPPVFRSGERVCAFRFLLRVSCAVFSGALFFVGTGPAAGAAERADGLPVYDLVVHFRAGIVYFVREVARGDRRLLDLSLSAVCIRVGKPPRVVSDPGASAARGAETNAAVERGEKESLPRSALYAGSLCRPHSGGRVDL